MKRTVFILFMLMTVCLCTIAQETFASQFKGKEGYSCVTLGNTAMKMMSNKGTLGREGFSEKLNLGNFADKVDLLEIVTATNPKQAEVLAKECNKWVESGKFECVIDVNEEGNQASIYAKIGGSPDIPYANDKNVFLLLAQDEETSVIIIYGSMTFEDLQNLHK